MAVSSVAPVTSIVVYSLLQAPRTRVCGSVGSSCSSRISLNVWEESPALVLRDRASVVERRLEHVNCQEETGTCCGANFFLAGWRL